ATGGSPPAWRGSATQRISGASRTFPAATSCCATRARATCATGGSWSDERGGGGGGARLGGHALPASRGVARGGVRLHRAGARGMARGGGRGAAAAAIPRRLAGGGALGRTQGAGGALAGAGRDGARGGAAVPHRRGDDAAALRDSAAGAPLRARAG